MIPIKTPEQIKIMQEGGRLLALVLAQGQKSARPGRTLKDLDQMAAKQIREVGGQPSFQKVAGYHWATCLNVNQGVVHGVPNDYQLKTGDLLSYDVGIFYRGFHTDMARSWYVGSSSVVAGQPKKFLEAGWEALQKATEAARPGNRVGHLSMAMEKVIKAGGYQPIRVLTGHGVGRKLHESPAIPCFFKGKLADTPLLKEGMVVAIEVIYAQGKAEIGLKEDGWTVETLDDQPAALFEDSVAIMRSGPIVLTT